VINAITLRQQIVFDLASGRKFFAVFLRHLTAARFLRSFAWHCFSDATEEKMLVWHFAALPTFAKS
jgi:hypothetical protein